MMSAPRDGNHIATMVLYSDARLAFLFFRSESPIAIKLLEQTPLLTQSNNSTVDRFEHEPQAVRCVEIYRAW
jgi:hypothetical protein